MRFHHILTASAAALLALLTLQGCGGAHRTATDTASADTSAIQPADTIPAEAGPLTLTSDGMAGITVGMPIADLPPEIDGVYDEIRSEDWDTTIMRVFMLQGTPRFSVYEFGSGKVDVISIEGPGVEGSVPGAEPGEGVCLGQPFARVLSLPGVKAEYESLDEDGMWVWQAGGLWFQPDQTHLSEEVSRRLYDPQAGPPSAEDLTDDVVVGYIGTGLPW